MTKGGILHASCFIIKLNEIQSLPEGSNPLLANCGFFPSASISINSADVVRSSLTHPIIIRHFPTRNDERHFLQKAQESMLCAKHGLDFLQSNDFPDERFPPRNYSCVQLFYPLVCNLRVGHISPSIMDSSPSLIMSSFEICTRRALLVLQQINDSGP